MTKCIDIKTFLNAKIRFKFNTFTLVNQFKMEKIILKDIKVYAYHGCLIEEGQIGSDYHINLSIEADLKKAANTDELCDTIDYVLLNKIVNEEMEIRVKLLETVAHRILHRIFTEITLVQTATIQVSKINPPIGGDVAMVSVEMSKTRK